MLLTYRKRTPMRLERCWRPRTTTHTPLGMKTFASAQFEERVSAGWEQSSFVNARLFIYKNVPRAGRHSIRDVIEDQISDFDKLDFNGLLDSHIELSSGLVIRSV